MGRSLKGAISALLLWTGGGPEFGAGVGLTIYDGTPAQAI